jgi:hypothetical protein
LPLSFLEAKGETGDISSLPLSSCQSAMRRGTTVVFFGVLALLEVGPPMAFAVAFFPREVRVPSGRPWVRRMTTPPPRLVALLRAMSDSDLTGQRR